MILDAATLLAYFDRTAQNHWAAAGEVEFVASFESLVVSPFVIAELEGAVKAAHGDRGWSMVLEELGGGAWTIASAEPEHLKQLVPYAAEGRTLAEASVLALAGDS